LKTLVIVFSTNVVVTSQVRALVYYRRTVTIFLRLFLLRFYGG